MSINSKRQQLLALFTKSERKKKRRRKRENIRCDHVKKGFKYKVPISSKLLFPHLIPHFMH